QVKMSVATARNGERETNQDLAVPCANHLPANLGSQRENAQGHQLRIAEAPDFLLQRDAGTKLFQRGAVAQHESRGGHGFSCCFDSCHSDSISSSDASAGLRPCSRNLSSRYSKRRRNLRFVLRSADSGSSAR